MENRDYKPKKQLIISYERNHLLTFIWALDKGGNPYERDKSAEYSLFEQACQTPGRSEYIKACIERRDKVKSDLPPDVNEVNPNNQHCPIHLAALSYDEQNLSQLLQCKEVLVDKKYQDRTALYQLFQQLKEDNKPEMRKKIFANIKLLLGKGADINEHNEAGVAALANIVTGSEDWRKEILEYCIENHELYLGSRKDQFERAIKKFFPALMKKVRSINEPAYLIRKSIQESFNQCDQELFLSEYRKLCQEDQLTPAENQELIAKTVKNRMLLASKELMKNLLTDGVLEGPNLWVSNLLEVCCAYGYDEIVEWFLQIIPRTEVTSINQNPLFVTLVKEMAERPNDRRGDFFSCMVHLLKDGRCDINTKDPLDCTALHHAAMRRLDDVQELLLQNGAYLGSNDVFGKQPISMINSALLDRHLDWCIKGEKPYSTNDYKEYKFDIDFRNFVPPKNDEMGELGPVVQLARSSGPSRELLRHPVIASMLLLKWHLLSRWFYANTIMCAIFFLSFMSYLVLDAHTDSSAWILIAELISWVGLIYIILRELVQLVLTWKSYFKSKVNWLEMGLIAICSVVLVTPHSWSHGFHQKLSILACALLTVEFVLLIGTLPLFGVSTHMVMLKKVSANFLKLLIPYCAILLPLGVMFHLLYQSPRADDSEQKSSWKNDSFGINVSSESTIVDSVKDENSASDDNSFNNFEDIGQSLLKMFVMFTGEFEAANMQLYESLWRNILFLIFLFVAFCVLYNVMNGVAVGDTGAIQADAELIGIKEKIFLVRKYERQLKQLHRLKFTPKVTKVIDWFSWLAPVDGLRLFPNVIGSNYITIEPYKLNEITYPETTINDEPQPSIREEGYSINISNDGQDNENTAMQPAGPKASCSKRNTKQLRLKQMDKQIVERAVEIINHKR